MRVCRVKLLAPQHLEQRPKATKLLDQENRRADIQLGLGLEAPHALQMNHVAALEWRLVRTVIGEASQAAEWAHATLPIHNMHLCLSPLILLHSSRSSCSSMLLLITFGL